MHADASTLERILWSQIERRLDGRILPERRSRCGAALRAVLTAAELAPEESALVAAFDPAREPASRLLDRLLEARVQRAMAEGLRVARGDAGGRAGGTAPAAPRVRVVRDVGGTAPRAGDTSVVEFLSDDGEHPRPPGARLDELVDLLVLANRGAAESLRRTLAGGPGPEPAVEVHDVEPELARLEDVVRGALPGDALRPAGARAERDLTGQLLGGKYRVKGLKGRGAFKTVYEGEDEMLGARVAVAVLNPSGARSPRALAHFQDEARKLTTLDHENIVRWITFDRTAQGLHYFVMEYLDGEELEQVLRREGRLAPRRVAAILLQVLGALRSAHAAGKHGSLLHLDLKPENVFLQPPLAPDEPERVKVIDFGIGQHVGAEARAAETRLRTLADLAPEELGRSIGSLQLPEDDAAEEPAGDAAARAPLRRRVQRARGGTLLYASPEQCRHLAGHAEIQALDGRSDLYSLGVMAFRMLTGQLPFARASTAYEAVQNHLEVQPRRVGSLGIRVPRPLAAFVDRCLIKDRERRWRDAGEAYDALARIVHPRLSPLAVALPVAAAAALAFGWLWATREPALHALTPVDASVLGLAERVVEELRLGPERPVRRIALESDAAWDALDPPRPALLDAASGNPLAGWAVRWAAGEEPALEIECLPGAASAAAVLELDAGRERWRSARLALAHLGAWRIEGARVAGADPARALDPRGRELELVAAGDAEGRGRLEWVEVRLADEVVASGPARRLAGGGEAALYRGPALDALYTGAARELELSLVARDQAGQERSSTLVLGIAGAPAELGPATGFVSRAGPGAASLSSSGETQVLLPENALSIEASARARASVFLEPAAEPALAAEVGPREPLLVSLSELGIAGADERSGTLRVELDDAPFVDRAAPAPDSLRLPFHYTAAALELHAELVAPGLELALLDRGEPGELDDARGPTRIALGSAARCVVRVPPGASLWLEASWGRAGDEPAPVRMRRGGAGFELELAQPDEGLHRLVLRAHALLAGDRRGPLVPPERVFDVEVDRTAPEVELAVEGGTLSEAGREPVFGAGSTQSLRARLRDAGPLAALRWTLARPDGAWLEGELEPPAGAGEADIELPPLAPQEAEGRYELDLVVRDGAGNEGRARSAWIVARAGPELALLEPQASGERRTWALGSGRAFGVLVRARDANGVSAVRARVVRGAERGEELDLVRAGGDLWELPGPERPSAHPWWTGEELVLELAALDGAGLETRASERALVPELPRASSLVIASRERAGAPMVEVDAGGEYVFGGRAGEGRRSWAVALARGAVRPFFLDAREVSRGEFLGFVRDSAGYVDARWWPAGARPDPARAARLASELARDAELAATGVAWAEASAYAAWAGKRLPTLVEWEYAVRGADYRDAPAAGAPGAAPEWPSSLCAGAREWTATPERLSDEPLDFASQCRRHPERLLDASLAGALGAVAHWVAGAGPAEAADWRARVLRADEPGHADVGFRCALWRDDAYALLDRGRYEIVD